MECCVQQQTSWRVLPREFVSCRAPQEMGSMSILLELGSCWWQQGKDWILCWHLHIHLDRNYTGSHRGVQPSQNILWAKGMIRKLACNSTLYPVICVTGNSLYLREMGTQESLQVSWRPYHLCKEKNQNSFERQQLCLFHSLQRAVKSLRTVRLVPGFHLAILMN